MLPRKNGIQLVYLAPDALVAAGAAFQFFSQAQFELHLVPIKNGDATTVAIDAFAAYDGFQHLNAFIWLAFPVAHPIP